MLIDDLRKLIEDYDSIQNKLRFARSHIMEHLKDFTPDELSCLAIDGIIEYTEIPVNKRSSFVKSILGIK